MSTSQFCIIDNSLSRHTALQSCCLRPAASPFLSSAVRTLILFWFGSSSVLLCTCCGALIYTQLYLQGLPIVWLGSSMVRGCRVLWLRSLMCCMHVNTTCVGCQLSRMSGYPLTNDGSKLHVHWEYVSRFIINLRVHMPSTSWPLMWLPC